MLAVAFGIFAATACGSDDDSAVREPGTPSIPESGPSGSAVEPSVPDPGTVETTPPESSTTIAERPARVDETNPTGWTDTVKHVVCPVSFSGLTNATCGIAQVPLDPADPAEGSVDVSFVVLKGSDPDFGVPLAVLQGGPGGASSEMALWFEPRQFTQVFIDQRGTGFADSDLNCGEVDEALLDTLALNSDEADKQFIEVFTNCAERLGNDVLFDHTNTANHAADVIAVMQALNDGPWAVYGVSYGTTIALEILRSSPDDLQAAVLDGVYPPDLDVHEALVFSADFALDALGAACDRSPVCSKHAIDVPSIVNQLIASYNDSPVTMELDKNETGLDESITVVVDGRRFAEFVFMALYSEYTAANLPAILASIDEGDEDALRWFVAYSAVVMDQQLKGLDEATYYAVACSDQLPLSDGVDVGPEELSAFTAALSATTLQSACEPWVRPGVPEPEPNATPVSSDIPVLLLSGEFDPVTPRSFAERAASTLSNATVVSQRGRAHGIWPRNTCIARIVKDFLTEPYSEVNTSCAQIGAAVLWPQP